MQEVWTICRIFKRSITYRKQQQQQAWRPPATVTVKAPPPGDSSSNTGSFESDGGGDEFMNCGLTPAISQQQQHGGRHQMMSTMSCNGGYFFNDGIHHSHSHHKLHSQWGSLQMAPPEPKPEPEQKPLSSPAMTIAFHQNDHGFPAAAADFYKDGYLEEIARMMEVADPSPTGFYDCRY
jgi:hypothetical protein